MVREMQIGALSGLGGPTTSHHRLCNECATDSRKGALAGASRYRFSVYFQITFLPPTRNDWPPAPVGVRGSASTASASSSALSA